MNYPLAKKCTPLARGGGPDLRGSPGMIAGGLSLSVIPARWGDWSELNRRLLGSQPSLFANYCDSHSGAAVAQV